MYNIEYHNNPTLLETINNENFNPKSGLRKKSYIDCCVKYNNFDIFKAIINHPKFNQNEIISNNFISDFISSVIKRVNLADIPENRKYLNEIYNLNINIQPHNITYNNIKSPFFFEIFEKINKTDHGALTSLITINLKDIEPSIFKHVFQYIKNNFPAKMNKQYIDYSFLWNIYENDLISLLIIIKNEGYDISSIGDKPAPLFCINNSKCLSYLVDEGIVYNNIDLLNNIKDSLIEFSDYQIIHINKILSNLVSNLDKIKKINPNFNQTPSNILSIILDKFSFSIYNNGFEKLLLNTIDLCFTNLKIINPINILPNYFLNTSINLKELILKLVYYNGKIDEKLKLHLIKKKLYTSEEIENINILANNKYKNNKK